MNPTVGHFSVRGLRLAHHLWGDPSHFPVLMLHGFMDHGRAFAPTVQHLEQPWWVIAPDHRGHGESGWIGDGGYYYFQDYFQDVLLLLDHLEIDRFALVGHSMGGSIATGVASLLPDRVTSILLIEGMGPPFNRAEDFVRRTKDWIDAVRPGRRPRRAMVDLDAARARLCAMNPRLSEEVATELAASFTEPVEGGLAWRFDPLHRTPSPKAYLRAEAEPMWRALTMPVLSLYGAETPFHPGDLEVRHACLPRGEHRIIPGAGHNIHHEQPKTIAGLIDDWIATS